MNVLNGSTQSSVSRSGSRPVGVNHFSPTILVQQQQQHQLTIKQPGMIRPLQHQSQINHHFNHPLPTPTPTPTTPTTTTLPPPPPPPPLLHPSNYKIYKPNNINTSSTEYMEYESEGEREEEKEEDRPSINRITQQQQHFPKAYLPSQIKFSPKNNSNYMTSPYHHHHQHQHQHQHQQVGKMGVSSSSSSASSTPFNLSCTKPSVSHNHHHHHAGIVSANTTGAAANNNNTKSHMKFQLHNETNHHYSQQKGEIKNVFFFYIGGKKIKEVFQIFLLPKFKYKSV